MRLGIIGCGNIAGFHVSAMRVAGFEISAVAGSYNSSTVEAFATKYGIPKFYLDPKELISDESSWDALLLLVPTSVMIEYINVAAPIGKPMLVEKPVSHDFKALLPVMDYRNVLVAYNRRFYGSTAYAKQFIDSRSNILVKFSIPEQRRDVTDSEVFPEQLPLLTYDNSVHLFDLVMYLAGKIEWDAVTFITGEDKYHAFVGLGVTEKNIVVQLDSYFNAPDNFQVNIYADDERVELKPLEVATHYKGMQVTEPTDKMPIRRYEPKLLNSVISIEENPDLKPGFLGQAKDFYNFCHNGTFNESATLVDAYNALETIDLLMCKRD